MSHEFKLKFDQLKNNDPTKKGEDSGNESSGNARNICFVQINGDSIFLSYGYLISGEFKPSENKIDLFFTSHTITISGSKLNLLFQEFIKHSPKVIECKNDRYNEISEDGFVVNTIDILKL